MFSLLNQELFILARLTVRPKKMSYVKSLIHNINALFVVHEFKKSSLSNICNKHNNTKEINQVGQANNLKMILTRLTINYIH